MTGLSAKPSKVRFLILALVTGGTMINYLDRTLLSVAAPSVTKELGLDAAVMGLVFSVFSWTYAAAQIPGGVFLDRFGARVTYALSVTFWSCSLSCRASPAAWDPCWPSGWAWGSPRRPAIRPIAAS
jgi:ACS family D-galactonate transporter-like MFS transporter